MIEAENLCARAARAGARLLAGLDALVREFAPVIKGTSGRGLLLALHADSARSAARVVAECAQKGLLVMTAFCDRTRVLFEPPLCIADGEVDFALEVLSEVLHGARGS